MNNRILYFRLLYELASRVVIFKPVKNRYGSSIQTLNTNKSRQRRRITLRPRSNCSILFVQYRSFKPWLQLRFSTRTGNLTSPKLLCDRSRRWLNVWPGVPNICNMLRKVQFDEYSATLSQQFYCRSCPWLYVQHSGVGPCNIREKCCVAGTSENVPHVAAALVHNLFALACLGGNKESC